MKNLKNFEFRPGVYENPAVIFRQPAFRACSKSPYNSEFGRICGVKRRKPGFSLQSFGRPKGFPLQ
ncbi:MAG: hypothetical protein LBQ57_09580, partial [Spirochaetales bacterium]|nr:hypothetical protein [Spirochaetales bacterium]